MGHRRLMSSLVLAICMAILYSSDAHNEPEDYIWAHSCIRKAYGLEPLCWDKKLADFAQAYAETRKDCTLEHNTSPYGENMGCGPYLSARNVTQLWIDEKPDYNYDTNECTPDKMCGHYTQVVWKNTKRVGCGRIQCVQGWAYLIVCNYDPPGNVVGQKPY